MVINRELSPTVKDVLSVGLAHAKIAVSHFLGTSMGISVEDIRWVNSSGISFPSSIALGMFCDIYGPLKARWGFLINEITRIRLSALLIHRYFSSGPPSAEMETSTFQEFGNIFVSSFLTGLSNLIPGRYMPSIPVLITMNKDNRGAFQIQTEHRDGIIMDLQIVLDSHPYPAHMFLEALRSDLISYFDKLYMGSDDKPDSAASTLSPGVHEGKD